MADVFISYSHADKEWARAFERLLSKELGGRMAQSPTIWRDERMPVGTEWERDMLKEAASARAFVALISPGWLASTPCQQELQAASNANIFGVRLKPENLPEQLSRLVYQDMFEEDHHGAPHTFAPNLSSFKKAVGRVAHSIAEHLKNPATVIDGLVRDIRVRVAPTIRELCGTMRILDMQQPIDAAAIYTALNVLERPSYTHSIEEVDAHQSDHGRFTLPKPKERVDALKALKQYARLMILGNPGTGKTTFLRRLAYLCAMGDSDAGLAPAYLELRKLGLGTESLIAMLRDQWGADPGPVLEAGRALLLLDGLDEVPHSRFPELKKELDGLLKRAAHCRVLITCRVNAREYQIRDGALVEIADFDEGQIRSFVTRWFEARRLPEMGAACTEAILTHKPVRELAERPLLLTMMCLLHESGFSLRQSRADLYGEALDLMLRKWDKDRHIKRDEAYSNLDPSSKKRLLGKIARSRFERNEYLFTKPTLEEDIRRFFPIGPRIDSGAVLRAIEVHHGLMVERAQGWYSFSHLTFQEYFTACQLRDDLSPDKWELLYGNLAEPRWREVIRLSVQMADPPDELLRGMKRSIESTLGSPEIQRLLAWLQRKVEHKTGRTGAGRAILWRAAYWLVGVAWTALALRLQGDLAVALDIDLARARDLPLVLARDLATPLTRDLALDLPLARDLALPLTRDLALDLSLAILPAALARDVALARDLGSRTSAGSSEREFAVILEDLRERARRGSASEEWWRDLLAAVAKYRDLGHAFPLTPGDFEALARAYRGYIVLVECLKESSIEPKVRKEIEDSLMLPSSAASATA